MFNVLSKDLTHASQAQALGQDWVRNGCLSKHSGEDGTIRKKNRGDQYENPWERLLTNSRLPRKVLLFISYSPMAEEES